MAYLGKTPSQAVRSRYYFTATGGETSLSGTDDNSNTLTFTDGNYVDVALNGVTLVAGTDYNTTTANTIGGLTALVASDVVEVIVYDTFSVFGGNMAANLNFKDNVKANFGTGNDLVIYHDGSNSIINDAGTGSLKFQYGGTDGVVFDSSGNVGIGTASPVVPLHLKSSSPAISLQASASKTSGSRADFNAYNSDVSTVGYIRFGAITDNVGTDMQFAIRPAAGSVTEAMRIDSSGNLLVGGTSQSGAANRAAIFSANKFGLSVIDTTSFATNVGGALNLGGNYRTAGDAQAFCRVEALKENATDGNFAYGMAFSTTPNGGTFTEAMRIDSSGNLLVGTTNTDPAFNNVTGQSMASTGQLQVTRDGGTAALFNRKTSDGEIVSFRKDGTTVGSIGNTGTEFYIGTPSGSDGYIRFQSQGLVPCTSTGANSDGTMQLGTASGRFSDLYLSGGVYLGGTGSANHLDDYEEGTWTPTLLGTTSNPTFSSIGNTTGHYVKIGNMVHVTYYAPIIAFTSAGSGTSTIGGLPFTAANGTEEYWLFQYLHGDALNGTTTGGYINKNGNIMSFVAQGSTASVPWQSSGSRYLMISASYRAA